MFTQYIKSQGTGLGYVKYNDKIAVAVSKSGLTLIGKANEVLGQASYIALFSNDTEWAMKPVNENEGGYKVNSHTKKKETSNARRIIASAFIREMNLQVGGLYIGVVKDGMVVFSKVTTILVNRAG